MTVLILGGGVGGLSVLRELAPLARARQLAVTLLDADDHHRSIMSHDLCLPLAALAARAGATFRQSHIRALAPRDQRVETADGDRLIYDQLVLAVGLGARLVPALHDRIGLHHLYGAPARERFRRAVADFYSHLESDQGVRGRATIIGGGLTGVEVARALGEVRERQPRQVAGRWEIELFEAESRLRPSEPAAIAAATSRSLDGLGVRYQPGRTISESELCAWTTINDPHFLHLVVWAGGQAAAALLDHPALRRDRFGRLTTDESLRAYGQETIWAVGDCAAVGAGGTVATARDHGSHVGRTLRAVLGGRQPPSYQPRLRSEAGLTYLIGLVPLGELVGRLSGLVPRCLACRTD